MIDCSGLVIAPGFIDCHSHLDWFMAMKNRERFTSPFAEQGITSVVGGNCGFSPAALNNKMSTSNEKAVVDNLFKEGFRGIDRLLWCSMAEFFQSLSSAGISHNLAMFVGHGSVRASKILRAPVKGLFRREGTVISTDHFRYTMFCRGKSSWEKRNFLCIDAFR